MKIEHIAIWTKDLDAIKQFYTKYFNMDYSAKYVNPKKNFISYFLSFKGAVSRIEIMHKPEMSETLKDNARTIGLAHISISVGGKQKVDELTDLFRTDGFTIAGEPRTTGDGYYESVVLDPEGNIVEVTE